MHIADAVDRNSHRYRQVVAAALAIAAGLAIAWMDSRPGWNDTGITAGLLVAAAFVSTLVARSRPLVWAVLVGVWTPLIEIAMSGQGAALAAFVFAGLGAGTAAVVLRAGSTR